MRIADATCISKLHRYADMIQTDLPEKAIFWASPSSAVCRGKVTRLLFCCRERSLISGPAFRPGRVVQSAPLPGRGQPSILGPLDGRRPTKKPGGTADACGLWVESIRTVCGPRQRGGAPIGTRPGLDREERIGWEAIGRLLSRPPPPEPGGFSG
ncbi:MAG: hypothetical protein P0120_11920 [Nitrospira sp.]|nr:hypothetical protein [Nitrospira sp.]